MVKKCARCKQTVEQLIGGKCRSCYQFLYRRRRSKGKPHKLKQKKQYVLVETLERSLKQAEECYDGASGLECRVRWRRRIESLENDIRAARAKEN